LFSVLTVGYIFFCAIVDFLAFEVLNSNNLSGEAVVGLNLFYPKSFRKQFAPGREKVGRWNEGVRAKRCDAVDWDQN